MSNEAWSRFVLRMCVLVSALLLASDMLAFSMVGYPALVHTYGLFAQGVDGHIIQWLSLLAWPTFLLLGLTLWLVAKLKELEADLKLYAKAWFWLFLTGYVVEAAGRLVLARPILGNGLAVAGSALALAAAFVYVAAMWRSVNDVLHRSIGDVLLQIGALWLLAALALHFTYNLHLTMDYGTQAYERAAGVVVQALVLGFVLNTGLWLTVAVLPAFLDIRRPNARAVGGIISYNIVLTGWVIGEAWCLQYPYTWVRLPLGLTGLALVGVTLYMLSDLGTFSYFTGRPHDERRLLSKLAACACIVSLLAAIGLIAGLGIWLGATNELVIPDNVDRALSDLLRLGVGTYLLISICAGFLGPKAMTGLRRWLVWGALAVTTLALAGQVTMSLIAPLTDMDLTLAEMTLRKASGIGHLLLAAWLLAAWLLAGAQIGRVAKR
jgi:hypothetical protein